jgi:hypothetical protein
VTLRRRQLSPAAGAFTNQKRQVRMNGNRNIFLIAGDRRPEAVILAFRRPYFLQKKVHFYLLLAVIATTLVSWFNLNSWLIIVLVACRLLDGKPSVAIPTAFSNALFLAYFSIFLLEVTGLFHTHDLYAAWKHVESKATLIAIPFIFYAGPFADRDGYRRLGMAYCRTLAAVCSICLLAAMWRYIGTGDPAVFFYHSLTAVLDSNAVFFSGYVLMALLVLLAGPDLPGEERLLLTLFFIVMMVLLASKLLLALLAVVLGIYLVKSYRSIGNRRRFAAPALLVLFSIGMLAFTSNPVRGRYSEMMREEVNGISFRLFVWRSAAEILDERHAWLFGVSAGDSRDLLNAKYISAGMSEGYIGYNCQNQYVEVLLRSGITGLLVLLAAMGILIGRARRKDTTEVWLAIVTILLLSVTESTLEMQQPVFLSCFFPLLFMGETRNRRC